MKGSTRIMFLAISLFVLIPLLAACGTTSTTTASCAFVVGNGQFDHDTKLHRVVYPGQKVTVDTDTETVSYVPCNSRNYIINAGNIRNANDELVGDRGQLIMATTKTGVPITIAARALWTLNQGQKAMADFYTICFKYTCASTQDQSGGANFSTKGWNGMLAENFGPAMDTSARIAAISASDSIWQQHDPKEYQALGDSMSAVFADVMRKNFGFPEDIFCGSGNSTWSDQNNPGDGVFTCSPVRIVVDDVQKGEVQADDSNAGVATINAQRLKNAQALYGENAGYWLAIQDTIEKCRTAGTTCIINVGGNNASPAVTVPTASPTPVPTPAPSPSR